MSKIQTRKWPLVVIYSVLYLNLKRPRRQRHLLLKRWTNVYICFKLQFNEFFLFPTVKKSKTKLTCITWGFLELNTMICLHNLITRLFKKNWSKIGFQIKIKISAHFRPIFDFELGEKGHEPRQKSFSSSYGSSHLVSDTSLLIM